MSDFEPTVCAVIRLSDYIVVNSIMALPSDTPPEGCMLVTVMNDQAFDIGWKYVDGQFEGPVE